MRIVELLTEKGASLRVLNAHIDTKTSIGKDFDVEPFAPRA
jgi:hypothetical protein